MTCYKCGTDNPDGINVCCRCGAEMECRAIDEQQLDDAQQVSAFSLNIEGEQPEKKRKPVGIILAIVGVLLVAAVLAALLIPACRAFFVRTFQSPEKLMYTVYSDAVESAVDSANVNAGEKDSFASKTDTHILLGDQVISMAASMLYSQPEDLEALSDIGISCTVDSRDELTRMLLTLSLSGTDIAGAEQYFDGNTGELYIALPDLQEQALLINDMLNSEDMETLEEFSNLKVDKQLLKTLTLRYMKQYFDAFETVNKASETVQLQGISQKLTVLDAKITDRAQTQVMIEILNAMKVDQDVKQFVESFASIAGDGCYEDFLESLDSAVSDMEDRLEDLSGENVFEIRTYLNGKNEIVGFAVCQQEAEQSTDEISLITVMDGRQAAQRIVLGDDLTVEGSGGYAEGLSMVYTGWYQDKEIMEVKVENLSRDAYGYSGKLTFIPAKEVVSGILEEMDMDSSIAQAVNLLDFSVELTLDSGENGKKTGISLMAGSSMLVGLTHESQPHQSESFALPENYISVDDVEGLSAWTESLQTEGLEKIMERLEEAGLSNLLLTFAAMMMQ